MKTNEEKQAQADLRVGAENSAHEIRTPLNALTVPPIIACSQAAYYRELPALLRNHYWEWVAYHGDECVGFARSETELYQKCLRRGLKPDEFVVLSVEPQALHDQEEIEPPCV